MPVERVVPTGVEFRLLEVGENVVIGPAGVAQLAPNVEVAPVASDVLGAVEDEGAPEHLAPGEVQATVAQPALGLALVGPVVPLQGEELGGQEGQVVGWVTPAAACLKERDPGATLAQAGRQHAAGRPSADDDEIEFVTRLNHQTTPAFLATEPRSRNVFGQAPARHIAMNRDHGTPDHIGTGPQPPVGADAPAWRTPRSQLPGTSKSLWSLEDPNCGANAASVELVQAVGWPGVG